MKRPEKGTEHNTFLKRLTNIIHDNLADNDFGAEALARAYGLSRSQLFKKLKAKTGKSISQFVNEVRLEEALQLLKQGELTVSEVSYRVGFSSPTYFASQFKKAYGYSPSSTVTINEYDEDTSDSTVKTTFMGSSVLKNRVFLGFGMLITAAMIAMFFILRVEKNPGYRENSIAVLAFDDMSRDKDQEYLSDGISEEILNQLTQYGDVKVISRKSSFMYKGKDVSVKKIGRELGVAYLLEGSIRKSGEIIRITAQLIDTKSGLHIWSKTYDRKIEDILMVQDQIAQKVAVSLNVTITNKEVIRQKIDPEAYDFYLRASNVMEGFYTDSTTRIAGSLIRKAIKIDDNYAPFWTVLAQSNFHQTIYYDKIPKEEGIEKGKTYARKAIELDSTFCEGYIWLSNYAWHDKDIETYERNLEIGKPLAKNNATALDYFMRCAARTNKLEEALDWAIRMTELNPRDPSGYLELVYDYFYFGEYDKAMENAKKVMELSPTENDYMNGVLAELYAFKQDFEAASQCIDKIKDDYVKTYALSAVKFLEGDKVEAKKHIEYFTDYGEENPAYLNDNYASNIHPFAVASLFALFGENDEAFRYLGLAEEYVEENLELLFDHVYFKMLHDDPRWNELIEHLNHEFNYNFNRGVPLEL